MDQPVSKAPPNAALRPASGAVMDRAVAPSRSRILTRRALRYGAPVAVAGLIWAGWRLVPASGTLSVSQDQLTVATVRSAPFLDYLPVRATVAPLNVTLLDALDRPRVV